MSGALNIPIDAGATRRVAFTVTLDGAPVDFTGVTVTFHSAWSTKALDVDDNRLSLELTPDETRRMTRTKYVISATWPSGDVSRLLSGYLVVDPFPEVA